MKVGDFITVDEISGTVDTITMLSVKVKTSDGRIVRIPNETIINAKLQNVSSHPTRRFDVVVSVSYDTDLRKALEILGTIPAKYPLVLADPQPIVFCTSFGASGIDITLGVWLNNSDLLAVRNQVFVAIKETFDSAGISIPFPRWMSTWFPSEHHPGRLNPEIHLWEQGNQIYLGKTGEQA